MCTVLGDQSKVNTNIVVACFKSYAFKHSCYVTSHITKAMHYKQFHKECHTVQK